MTVAMTLLVGSIVTVRVLGHHYVGVVTLQLAFELGGARRVFVHDQIDGWYDDDDPGPWQPGYGDSAFTANAGRQR